MHYITFPKAFLLPYLIIVSANSLMSISEIISAVKADIFSIVSMLTVSTGECIFFIGRDKRIVAIPFLAI